jgi:hypothetical protein
VFYEVGTRCAHLFGEAHTAAGHIEGAALWTAPDSGDFTSDRMAAAGGDKSSAALGPEAFGRFMKLMTHLGGLRAAAMSSPHWYLMILGAEPSRQGIGRHPTDTTRPQPCRRIRTRLLPGNDENSQRRVL